MSDPHDEDFLKEITDILDSRKRLRPGRRLSPTGGREDGDGFHGLRVGQCCLQGR